MHRTPTDEHLEMRPLTRPLLNPVAEVLAQAFVNDPAYVWMFRRLRHRQRAVRLLNRGYLKLGLRAGTSFAVLHRGRVVGGTVLSAANTQRTLLEYVVHGMAPLVLHAGYRTTRDMLNLSSQLGRIRQRYGPEQTWFGTAAGIDPNHHGHGWGGFALAHGIDLAQRDGLPLTFFTMKATNVAFYEKWGCRVLHHEILGGQPEFGCWLLTTQS